MNTKTRISALAMCALGASYAGAQDWTVICINPDNTAPRSTPYVTQTVSNNLIRCVTGISGTVTYGGDGGPCFDPAKTTNIAGRFALSSGPVGSNQKTSSGWNDANMGFTFGAATDPIWCYAATTLDGTKTRWGAGGIQETFHGFSNRYAIMVATDNNVQGRLQCEVVADAVRYRWTLTNTDTTNVHTVGLYFGAAPDMILPNGGSSTGDIISGGFGKAGYIMLPSGRPPLTDKVYDRTTDATGFPSYVDFLFGQTDYLGFRIENQPSESTDDVEANQPTIADGFWIGTDISILGDITDNAANFPNGTQADRYFLSSPGFSQRFPEISVQPGASRQVLHYVRSRMSSVANYQLPFGVCLDTPRMIAQSPTDVDGNTSLNGLFVNPVPMRMYVDNVGGFAFDEKEFPLNDVRITVAFDSDSGVSLAGANAQTPWTRELTIPVVNPQQLRWVDFSATLDENVVGVVPYTVTVKAQPGNVVKVLHGHFNVASRSRLQLYPDANMIGLPFDFSDTSFEAIFAPFLDPNVPGGDLQFYQYNAQQQGYVIVNSAPRGEGFWAIYNKTGSSPVTLDYAGNPALPDTQFLNTAPLVRLRGGFNMISNPYNYRIPLNQIAGVSASAPQISRTFREMIDLGYVQSFLTTWNPLTKDYDFISSEDGYLEPHRGYWINVLTTDDLTLNYPPVYEEGVPGSPRRPTNDVTWKLRLAARTAHGQDSENYIAQVTSNNVVKRNTVNEPPVAPADLQKVAMAITETTGGTTSRLAQAATASQGRREFNVEVRAFEAGDVTVTWPNLATLPKNVRLRIEDPVTSVTRSLRQTSGYTFKMAQAGTRNLKVSVEEGGADVAVIGNIVVSTPGRGTNAPVTINYTLGGDATTSVRILSSSGKEVYSVHRGRADRVGENTVTWNMRNSANRAVAPGTYRVEVLAESASGERVRKFAVINVVR